MQNFMSEAINFFEARETPDGEVETRKNLIAERSKIKKYRILSSVIAN